ncbi:hypothetical protein [Dickeya zeae]|uniref:hypothetical protein n=1 Tax=Dickeya zeae TaxID=204042 RepID=UPI0020974A5C|nr:hypothetical protein [Dickeya zeae]MCO7262010.1 hypothetical protein [Dickeya zeae]
MRTIDHHGNIICVLEKNEMLTECPHGAYAVFEDIGDWLVVKILPDIAIPLHIEQCETMFYALNEIGNRIKSLKTH